MRLDQLHLTRYGKFTDTTLSFGATPGADRPDLHLIHGPNEAGKSTVLSGWLDLLFGIPLRSQMNFLHDYKAMQLGARLHLGDRELNLTRIKKRSAALLDADGTPLPEATIAPGLNGLTRDSYGAMFSLNRQTLDEGGESILASQGALGELLFQASAGMSHLSAQLAQLDQESQAFLSHSGRSGTLRDMTQTLRNLGDQIREIDTQATAFGHLIDARNMARDAFHAARTAADKASERLLELGRLEAAQRIATQLARIEAQLAVFADLPEPPADWLTEASALDRAEADLGARRTTAEQTLHDLEQELAALPPPDPVLELSDALTRAEALKAAHDTALDDLPRREKDRTEIAAQIAESLSRLGQPGADPGDVLPEAALTGKLRGLVEDHARLHQAHQSARAELDRACDRADQAQRQLAEAGGILTDPGELRGLLNGLRRTDPQGALDRARAGQDKADAALTRALAALTPWRGDDTALAALTLPDRGTLQELARTLSEATQQRQNASATLALRRDELEQQQAALDALGPSDMSRTTPEQAAQIRARREAAWAAHLQVLNADTADAFEQAMRLDDQATARQADHSARAERKRAAVAAVDIATRRLDAARQDLAQQDATMVRLQKALTRHRMALSPDLPEEMGADQLLDWLGRADSALTTLLERDETAREVARLTDLAARALTDLTCALAQAGRPLPEGAGLVPAMEIAQTVLDGAERRQALHEAAQAAEANKTERQRMEARSKDALSHWQTDWDDALDSTVWGNVAPEHRPAPAEMRAMLDELAELRGLHDTARELDNRIAKMKDNRDRFAGTVRDLAPLLGLDPTLSEAKLWQAAQERQAAARTVATRRTLLTQRLAKAREALGTLTAEAARHEALTARIIAFFGVADWAGARIALSRATDRAALFDACAERREELCETLNEIDSDAALARLEGLDALSIASEISRLNNALDPLRQAREEAQERFHTAQHAVDQVGGDGQVARLEEQRQTLLLQIEEGAQNHLRRRLGLLAVEDALRHYRDTHRSAMMTRASQAFATMTGGCYDGLTTQPDATQEVLVALPAEGGSRQVTQLSEGTRAQLYLALRIAGYHEFVAQNGPVPFIADDIMESFDDERTIATFRLLAEMSKQGQVIYLTHHAHLRDLAQTACAEVTLLELES